MCGKGGGGAKGDKRDRGAPRRKGTNATGRGESQNTKRRQAENEPKKQEGEQKNGNRGPREHPKEKKKRAGAAETQRPSTSDQKRKTWDRFCQITKSGQKKKGASATAGGDEGKTGSVEAELENKHHAGHQRWGKSTGGRSQHDGLQIASGLEEGTERGENKLVREEGA